MLFNSDVFLFAFLPIVLLGFHLLRRAVPGVWVFLWLFAASVFFYGYWQVDYIWLLAGSIVFNFIVGRAIMRTRSGKLLALGVTCNIVLLAIYKYLGFFGVVLAELTGLQLNLPHLTLPIGISFFTFTQIAFLVDAYRGEVNDAHPVNYGLFVTFFPHLIAGPIVHHREMMPQFFQPQGGERLWRMSSVGLMLLAIGLFKKVVIADNLAEAASPMFDAAAVGSAPHFFSAWSGTLAYTLQIYFDFSGYSDMAIGLGLLFGIRFPANFNSPYKARDIIDFWRRWHMTLSRFLRDYLYIPLGGNRHGRFRRYFNLLLVMTIGGLWHGAGWTFVLWGLLHGTYLMINHAWLHVPRPVNSKVYRLAAHVLTMLCVIIAWVPFRAPSLDATLSIYQAMFGFQGLSLPLEFGPILHALHLDNLGIALFAENSREDFYIGLAWILVAGVIAVVLPNSLELTQRYRPNCDFERVRRAWTGAPVLLLKLFSVDRVTSAIFIGVILFAAIKTMNAAAKTEFLYFNF